MVTRTVADPDEGWGALRPSHPLFGALILISGILSAMGVVWLAGKLELPTTWYGSGLIGSCALVVWGFMGLPISRLRSTLAPALFLSFAAFSYFFGGEPGESLGVIFALVMAERWLQRIWRKFSWSSPKIEPSESEDWTRRGAWLVGVCISLGLGGFLYESWDLYGSASALQPAFVLMLKSLSGSALGFLVFFLLLGPAIFAALMYLPLPQRNRAVIVPFVLLVLSSAWNVEAWLRFEHDDWVLLGHALVSLMPIAGIVVVIMLGPRRMDRFQFVAVGLWLYAWLLGPAFPVW
jgi:hypothetical protein